MGGVYDPETKSVRWTMHVPLEEQLAYYRSHPPSHLAAMTARPITEKLDFTFDGHGEPVNAIFALACSCGGVLFDAYCHIDDDEVYSPISIQCNECEMDHVIFDANEHGYDARVGGLPRVEVGPDAYEIDFDISDIESPHHVIVRFEMPSDHLGNGEYEGREQDLFSWITIVARDPSTGELAFVFDSECA